MTSDTARKMTVTYKAVDDAVKCEYYFTAGEGVSGAAIDAAGADGVLTSPLTVSYPSALERIVFCVLILHNGFKIVGVNTGGYDESAFSLHMAKQLAYADAHRQLLMHLGYMLYEQPQAEKMPNPELQSGPEPVQ